MPTPHEILSTVLLQSYNTRVVVLGTAMLGLASGITGAFLLLRKRSLMGDALSHATFPGIGIAFALMVSAGGNGKNLPGLLTGATISGVLGVLCMLAIRNTTRLRDDVAMGFALSVFSGPARRFTPWCRPNRGPPGWSPSSTAKRLPWCSAMWS